MISRIPAGMMGIVAALLIAGATSVALAQQQRRPAHEDVHPHELSHYGVVTYRNHSFSVPDLGTATNLFGDLEKLGTHIEPRCPGRRKIDFEANLSVRKGELHHSAIFKEVGNVADG